MRLVSCCSGDRNRANRASQRVLKIIGFFANKTDFIGIRETMLDRMFDQGVFRNQKGPDQEKRCRFQPNSSRHANQDTDLLENTNVIVNLQIEDRGSSIMLSAPPIFWIHSCQTEILSMAGISPRFRSRKNRAFDRHFHRSIGPGFSHRHRKRASAEK